MVDAKPEPVTFVTEDGLQLEGVFHPVDSTPAPAIVACHPHPQYGGDMHNNVVDAIVRAANDNGIAALRFNFRGVGRSDGAYDAGAGEQQDVTAAVAYLRARDETAGAPIGIGAYSFGAAVSIRAAGDIDELAALALVSTPTVMGEIGAPGGTCPVLFVSGDRDEYSDPADLRRLAEEMGEHARVEIIEGVDHFWWGADERLREVLGTFLAAHLKEQDA